MNCIVNDNIESMNAIFLGGGGGIIKKRNETKHEHVRL